MNLNSDKMKKALTFSFDDGSMDDIRLVEILNRYGLRATFNLNSGNLSFTAAWRFDDKKDVHYINYIEHPHLYDGHEIACHTYTHPRLDCLDTATIRNEIALDKKLLSYLYGSDVRGMALPYGAYNDIVVKTAAENGMAYCRTVEPTYGFSIPDQILLHPTCHFLDDSIWELARVFLESETNRTQMFYIWGHSYELVTEDDWTEFESFCRSVSGHDNVWYCTNIEAIEGFRKVHGHRKRWL